VSFLKAFERSGIVRRSDAIDCLQAKRLRELAFCRMSHFGVESGAMWATPGHP
jgi:hypothetical protein